MGGDDRPQSAQLRIAIGQLSFEIADPLVGPVHIAQTLAEPSQFSVAIAQLGFELSDSPIGAPQIPAALPETGQLGVSIGQLSLEVADPRVPIVDADRRGLGPCFHLI